jgi:predicted Abi (CAAX) family protease
MKLIIILIFIILLSALYNSQKITEGVRGRYKKGTGTGTATVGCNLSPVKDEIKKLEKKVDSQNKDINNIQETAHKIFCEMINKDFPKSERDRNNISVCTEKAKEYGWSREYWNY